MFTNDFCCVQFLCWLFKICCLFSFGFALERPPDLECMNDAIRMHFVPEGVPFYGHVYVKGFFFTTRCHLDYTHYPISEPFFFHIPYRSECQVRRERAVDGVIYSVMIIVQHHRLFVTSADKAYRISCFYRDTQNRLEQEIEIGDPIPEQINGTDQTPTCRYEVLQGSLEGEPVKYANLGDVLIHKWTCDSDELGTLVHSCIVRDAIGNEFVLLDDRGCVTDNSLMHPPSYSPELNVSYSLISAFKFADQMVVYFTCQITLCTKRNNGCEGITPPICMFDGLPSSGGTPLAIYNRNTSQVNETNTQIRRATTIGNSTNTYGLPYSNYSGFYGGYIPYPQIPTIPTTTSPLSTTTSNTATEPPLPGPTEAIIFRQEVAAARHARSTKTEDDKKKKNLTIDVVADQLIILTKDDKMQLHANEEISGCSFFRTKAICFAVVFAILVLSFLIVLLQHMYFQRKLLQFGGFCPPFELTNVKS